MTSPTLRSILRSVYGVEVGPHSYGSLLEPGAADRQTRIGAYVSVGPGVRRFGAAHPIDRLSLHPYAYNPALGFADGARDVERTSCEIGDDTWIGANVIILPRCTRIGTGVVIGAGTVVTGDVPDFSVVFGNPGRVHRLRLEPSERELVLGLDYAALSPQQLVSAVESYESSQRDRAAP
ncbi:CatB-related O-acetyltransferase [Cellulomonas sp.]|uniref:CatB-related O-acetyltransferase n=1 Tax=Cellulomonas sp. TaxID=40001 RepID=UPI003BAC65B0